MNFGGFAGGFSQGFMNGITIGKTFKQAQKENALEQTIKDGQAEAQARQQADVDGMVKPVPVNTPDIQKDASGQTYPMAEDPMTADQPVQVGKVAPASEGITQRPADTPAPSMPITSDTNARDINLAAAAGDKPASITPQASPTQAAPVVAGGGLDGGAKTPWSVGGKGFATREEALAYAKTKATPVTDYFYQTVYPKMVEQHVANGDVDKAEALQTFIESKRGKDAVKTFGTAMQKLMFTNDINGGVQALGNYYNKFIDDGVDFTKGEVGQDGKINITVKNRADGKESVMSMTSGELVRLGMAHDPTKLLELGMKQVEKKEAQQAEAAKEQRKFNRDVALKGIEHGYKQAEKKDDQNFQIEKLTTEKQLEAANAGAKAKAEAKAGMDIMRQNGYSEDQVRAYLPAILKLGDHKKVTDPTERRAIIVTELTKNPMFANKPADVLNKEADKLMGVIYSGASPTPAPAGATPASPAAGGMTTTPGKGKGVPVYDAKTGQIIYK